MRFHPKQTYLFYDLETSGLNKCFDQVVQFAAIRTDLELCELDRHEFLVKLRKDVLPTPAAFLTHQLSLTSLQSQGLLEYRVICQIHQLLNQPGTISLGYNTLEFDDSFLRFSFYRNLLPPYTHQYAEHCGRMDLLPMTLFYYLYAPETCVWPKVNDKISLKLEHLSNANNFASGQAHHAMVDVEATLALAKRLHQNTTMWEYLTGFFQKHTEQKRFESYSLFKLAESLALPLGIMTHSQLGYACQYQAPVLNLGIHHVYRNQQLWLRLDNVAFSELSDAEWQEKVWILRKKFAEPGFVLPKIARFWRRLDPTRLALAETNLEYLQNNVGRFSELQHFYLTREYPLIENLDPMAALYQNGFLSKSDEHRCQQFHQKSLKDKIQLVGQFDSEALNTLSALLVFQLHTEEERLQSEPCNSLAFDFVKQKALQYFHHILHSDPPYADHKGAKRIGMKNWLDNFQSIDEQTLQDNQKQIFAELKAHREKYMLKADES